MAIKLCAFDMDGTFLNENHQVSAASKEAIKKLQLKDIVLVPTTGRCLDSVPQFLIDQQAIDFSITSNGARTYQFPEMTTIDHFGIATAEALAILECCKKYPVVVSVHIQGKNYDTVRWMKWAKQLTTHRHGKPIKIIRHLRRKIQTQQWVIDKIQIFSWRESKLNQLITELAQLGDYCFPMSGGHYVEVTQKNATKGQALVRLCQRLNIDLKDVMVIGDGENDFSMFDVAGHAVAMGNAVPKLKEKATFVTSSNHHEGFANAIDLFLL